MQVHIPLAQHLGIYDRYVLTIFVAEAEKLFEHRIAFTIQKAGKEGKILESFPYGDAESLQVGNIFEALNALTDTEMFEWAAI